MYSFTVIHNYKWCNLLFCCAHFGFNRDDVDALSFWLTEATAEKQTASTAPYLIIFFCGISRIFVSFCQTPVQLGGNKSEHSHDILVPFTLMMKAGLKPAHS